MRCSIITPTYAHSVLREEVINCSACAAYSSYPHPAVKLPMALMYYTAVSRIAHTNSMLLLLLLLLLLLQQVQSEPVSVHWPLHRFLARLVVSAAEIDAPVPQLTVSTTTTTSSSSGDSSVDAQLLALGMLEHPLRALVRQAQVCCLYCMIRINCTRVAR
jgi:hypothetical protein